MILHLQWNKHNNEYTCCHSVSLAILNYSGASPFDGRRSVVLFVGVVIVVVVPVMGEFATATTFDLLVIRHPWHGGCSPFTHGTAMDGPICMWSERVGGRSLVNVVGWRRISVW